MKVSIKPTELTSRAIKDLRKLKSFYAGLYGDTKAEEINDTIFERMKILENPDYDFEKIGERDDAFSHLKRNYRKLIQRHCKITYREGKSKIYIVRVFDTRQDPRKNK